MLIKVPAKSFSRLCRYLVIGIYAYKV